MLILSQLVNFEIGLLEMKRVPWPVTKTRLMVLLVSLASVILNGHGAKMYLYPFINMSDGVMLSSITE